MLHRNSLKRIYYDSVYFITTNTYYNISYFEEEIFCRLFIDNLKICKQLKGFNLYGFVIIPWHVHLLIRPGKKYNISQVIQSLKRNFAYKANIVNSTHPLVGENRNSRLDNTRGDNDDYRLPLIEYRCQFKQKYGQYIKTMPYFKWQQSFYDRRVRNEHEFQAFQRYIAYNPVKHGLTDDTDNYPWSSANPRYQNLID